MRININIKQLSKRGRRVKPVAFDYKDDMTTVEDFIKATVRIMYECFMAKKTSEDDVDNILSEEEITNMAEIGKIAFDLVYGGRNVTLDKAIETAIMAYKDGLVILFVGDEERAELDSPINLKDGDEVTFIRLTFLAGRIW